MQLKLVLIHFLYVYIASGTDSKKQVNAVLSNNLCLY